MNRKHYLATLLALVLIPFVVGQVLADEVAFGEDREPTVEALVDALKMQPVKLRGINYNPEMEAPKMASVNLEFELNSAELTENTKKTLSIVGKALNTEDLRELTFVLEGHADASGGAEYNLNLSQKRAESVKQYLVQQHNIDPETLTVVGKGSQELLDQENPTSAKNRRVRIVTQ
jgi:outer membrane protein OmpA-like peptidoglycan-associated protein